MKILAMVGEGKITAEEATRLLDAVGDDGGSGRSPGSGKSPGSGRSPSRTSGEGASTVQVRVSDGSTGETPVNFALPLGLARFVSNMVPRGQLDQLSVHGVDLDEALDAIDAGATGVIVDTETDDAHHVKVWLE